MNTPSAWFSGFEERDFDLAGAAGQVCIHARIGGRLDAPPLLLIDIAPTLDMFEATDMRLATAYYHWFFLIQPTPQPERLIGSAPLSYLHWKFGGWGAGSAAHVEPEALAPLWRAQCAAGLIGHALPSGHYIPEEVPAATAEYLLRFFSP